MKSRPAPRGAVRLALSFAIATTIHGASTLDVHAGPPGARVLVPEGIYRGDEPGARLLHDYGAFQLYAVDGVRLGELRSLARGAIQEQKDAVEFEAAPFDPRRGVPADVPAAFRAGKPLVPAIRLVQFAGPTVDAWLDAVRATGASIVQYVPNNAYLVLADGTALAALQKLAAADDGTILHADTLDPWFKLNGALARRVGAGLGASRAIEVTVLVASHAGSGATKGAIASMSRGAAIRGWSDLGGYEATTITIAETDLATLAQLPDVVAIEDYVAPRRRDEVQNQIIAGNFAAGNTGPSAPGYLQFLTGLGFPPTPASYPLVAVVDDGVGNGTTVLGAGDVTLTVDGANATSRLLQATNCSTSPNAGGVGGHGHINTSIVGGFDVRAGLPFVDALGYRRGQGVNPFARLANFKIFTDGGTFSIGGCGGSIETLIRQQQDAGVAISSNSWGASVAGDYNADSRAFDIGTRDADLVEGGVQPMVFVFAAGNSGSGSATVGSPGTAKNVITVGASENRRPSDESGAWTDGCGIGPSGADNAMDVISFSSRGPAEGNRIKPEVIAPGTHVNGAASTSTSPAYNGTGVCDQFRPTGQTVFAASSGTSHSTPAIAGVSSLVHNYLASEYGVASASAALTKAYLVAHPTYLTGVAGNGNLPTNVQGYGMPNLGNAFDGGLERVVRDQGVPFGASGEATTVTVTAVDSNQPVRIALVWSDAPGATSGSPVVNNLDLSVVNSGNTFRGNVFTGQFSVTGGTADAANNYEAVFLPVGTTGIVDITVTATNVAGDGVPGNADTTDQDYALVCVNCTVSPTFAVDVNPETAAACGAAGAPFTVDVPAIAGFIGTVDLSTQNLPAGATATFGATSVAAPGSTTLTIGTAGVAFGTYAITTRGTSGAALRSDTISLQVSPALASGHAPLVPASGATNTTLTPTLAWSAAANAIDYVVEVDDDPAFGSIDRTSTTAGTSYIVSPALPSGTQFHWRVRARNSCGSAASATSTFTTSVVTCATFASANVPLAIGPNAGTVTNSTLAISAVTGSIADLDVVGLRGTHTFMADLDVELIAPAPGSQTRRLFGDICTSTDNFDLNLDDAAAAAVGSTCPPVGGQTVRPENTLAFFNNLDPNGTWTLRITDDANADSGQLQGWGLRICAGPLAPPVVATDDAAMVQEDGVVTVPAPGVLGNDTPPAGQIAVVFAPAANGNVALSPSGAYTYTPAANFCGTDTFDYQSTDGSSADIGRVTVTVACVNDLPEAVADTYVTNEDTTLDTNAATGVLANDDDPVEGSPLTAGDETAPSNGVLTLDPDGSVNFVPGANFCGTDSFTYRANDGTDDSAPATVTLNVVCINDAPVAVGDTLAVTEDTAFTLAAPGVLANDTDVEGSPLAPVFPTTPANGALVLGTNGSVSYVPNANYCGADAFTYRVTDAELFSGAASVGIAVACVDDGPTAVADAATVAEDATATAVDVLANDTDVDAGPRSVASVTQPANGVVAITGGGTGLTFQPAANFCGATAFTYTANGGSAATVSMTVSCVNDAPTATGTVPNQTRTEGQAHTLAVASYFSDVDAGDTLAFSATGLPGGLAIDPATGTISGTIAIGQAAASPFNVVVTARDAANATATRTFTFNVASAADGVFAHGFED